MYCSTHVYCSKHLFMDLLSDGEFSLIGIDKMTLLIF